MRFWLVFVLSIVVCSPARAASEPIIAPPGGWVETVDIPEPGPQLADRAIQHLLLSAQTYFGPDTDHLYLRTATLVQNAQGRAAAGNIAIPWQPDQTDLIVHFVRIRRGDEVIDLLEEGHEFTVLRRENNLEAAMLDGVLTAAMQVEGLSIGDTLDVAFTMRRRQGAIAYRGESIYVVPAGAAVRIAHYRTLWDDGRSVRWQASDAFGRPRSRNGRFGRELVLTRRDVEAPKVPDQAPARFSLPAVMQVTEYEDWAEISRLMAPLYARARTLSDSSRLRAEIARIAALSEDPHVRAMAALRFVQDEIRYFAMAMGDGNMIPASADQTWTRRFGDCKGKTAVLLALLDGLGIEAEPVAVNTAIGDGMDSRLPQIALFDHVIVRVRIDGRSYWLDGTRVGDRHIEDLAGSMFDWGLPLREAGADLERIPYAPPALPLFQTDVVYDASNGIDGRVPATIELIMRGEAGAAMDAAMSQVGRDELIRQLRAASTDQVGDFELADVEVAHDPERSTFTVRYRGTSRMEWLRVPGGRGHRFRFSNDTIHWDATFERPDGQPGDIPFSLNAPVYLASSEAVILPSRGEGFRIEGSDFERVVAGTVIGRKIERLEDRITARSYFRRIQREVDPETARSDLKAIAQINDDEAFVRSGAAVAVQRASIGFSRNELPRAARDSLAEGFQLMRQHRFEAALARFDEAIALAPRWAIAYGNKALCLMHLGRHDEAAPLVAKAESLDPNDFVVQQAIGVLALAEDRAEDAVAAFTRSIEADPGNIFSLTQRAEANARLERFESSLTDFDEVLALQPENAEAHRDRARLLARLGRGEEAIAAMDRAVAVAPDDSFIVGFRGELLARLGHAAEADRAYRAALRLIERELEQKDADWLPLERRRISILSLADRHAEAIRAADAALARLEGNVLLLAQRCETRVVARTELDVARAACDEAVAADPENRIALYARGLLNLATRQWEQAEADFESMLANEPMMPQMHNAQPLYARALARMGMGHRAQGEADIAAALRYTFDTDEVFGSMGFRPDSQMVEASVAEAAAAD